MRIASRLTQVAILLATALATIGILVQPALSASDRNRPSAGRVPFKRPAVRPFTRPPSSLPELTPDTVFGAPLAGLTDEQLAAFNTGLAAFNVAETPASGLGPIMNNRSCIACHGQPAAGGGSPIRVTRFGRTVNGVFDPMSALGGSLLQQNSIDPRILETIPAEATTRAPRQSTPLFGMGLVEAIPESVILSNAEQQRALGLNGVPSLVTDPASGQVRIGRFGWKAQHASVLAFSADAYTNEMGITNRLFPQENAPNGNTALLAQFDRIADPEDRPDPVSGKADFEFVADFMRFLGPPPVRVLTPSALQGKLVFDQVRCSGCHTPQMMTGPNTVAALNFKPVRLYSDLLLHDMGALGDGIADGTAGPRDMKTAPLWGLRASGPYLHDGRAATVDQAIQQHDGEAAASRDAYRALDATRRQQLLDFLDSI